MDEAGLPLAGAVFEIRTIQGALITEVTTNQGGLAIIPELAPGVYEIIETRAPQGFEIVERARVIQVFAGQVRRERFVNYRTPSLIIEKVDGDGNPLAGAEFEIRRFDNDALVQRVTTNNQGVATIPALAPATYTVLEVRAPDGHILDSTAQFVTVSAGETATLRFVNFREPSLIIEKVDGNGLPLAGATFEIRTLAGALVREVVTNQGGLATVTGLTPGAFEIIETVPPQGYVIVSRSRIVEFVAGQNVTVRFVNLRQPGLVIEKIDGDGNPLSGAEFELRTVGGELLHRVVTGQGGIAAIEGLTTGTFVLSETRAPQGFEVVEASRVIEFVAGESRTERFVNLRTPSLVIEKIDNYGNPLFGAEFEIRTMAGALLHRVTTNHGGVAVVPQIAPGTYQVLETRSPDGFALDSNAQFVTMVAGESATLRFVNYRLPSLVIEKVDGDGNPLAGAEFEIRTMAGALVERVTTNSQGVATIARIEPNMYQVLEVRAPEGFVLDSNAQFVEVRAGQSATVRFVNLRQPSLIIEKLNADGLPLAGATFEVRTLAGALVTEVVTNHGGLAIVPNLNPGVYEIIETVPPTGYVIVARSRVVEFVAGQSVTVRFVNLRQPGLVIEKVDANGLPLAGAEFELRTPAGELLHRVVTNQGGIVAIEGLATGTFVLSETRAPQGFEIIEVSRVIEFVSGESRTERFVNLRTPSLVIEKIDSYGNPLPGAEFEIRTLSGTLVERVVTNNGGIATIEALAPNSYQVIEVRAPEGFVLDSNPQIIEVRAGESISVRFVNHREPNIVIEKVDSNGNPLAGAEFEIRTLTGELVRRGVTNQGGMLIISGLAVGAYEIIETIAPDGFVITEPSRHVQVVAGQTLTERFVNYRTPSLIIEKVCQENGLPLAGAEFEIRTLAGALVQRVVTNQGGLAIIERLEPGAYTITETRPPQGFAVIEASRAIEVVAGETLTVRFVNARLATFVIRKIDGVTESPLQGVVFEITTLEGEQVRNPATGAFEFVTDEAGLIRLPQLEAGAYVAVEIRPLAGFMAADPVHFVVGHDRDYIVTVRNYPYPDWNILKLDGATLEPMAGVQFEISTFFANGQAGARLRNPADGSYLWTTDNAGLIRIPNLEHGVYVATELRTIDGFMLAEPVIFTVDGHQPSTVVIHNYRYPLWNIRKLSGDTGLPLAGVVFEVSQFFGSGTTGERIRNELDGSFEFVTGVDGIARIGALPAGTFIISEIRALSGYVPAEPVIITVSGNDANTTVTIYNYKMATYVIRKIDGDTNQPLQGVVFEIAHYFGNGNSGTRIRNPINGSFEFVTDEAGLIYIPSLPQGVFVAIETQALYGYILAEPVVFVVGDNENTTITIRNFRQPFYTVIKTDGNTNQPLAGVVFELATQFGNERVRNPQDGGFEFVTDSDGMIRLPQLEVGVAYVLSETRPLVGYHPAQPLIFVVGDNANTTLRVRNYRIADVVILKICGDTNAPLAGVEFEIAHYLGGGRSGERLINPANGTRTFVTDNAGMIHLPALDAGMYQAIETRALAGYALAEPVTFTVSGTENQVITIRNYKQPSVVIRKICGDTGRPLEGVVFRIAVYLDNGRTGQYLKNYAVDNSYYFVTNASGHIYLPTLPDGRYIATEVRSLPGFMLAAPVIFRVGINGDHTVIIRNYRYPDFAILKIDGDTNAPLQGVEFEIAHYLGGGNVGTRLVNPANGTTTFVTDSAGMIPLPSIAPGMYVAIETRALSGYSLASPEIFIVPDNHGQAPQDRIITIRNFRIADWVIRKTDGDTGLALAGVHFEIARYFGSGQAGERLQNPVDGSFTFITDVAGLIRLPNLAPGTYIVSETRALPGYILAEPVIVVVAEGANNTTIDIQNFRAPNLTIRKINSVTRAPIAGVVFQISRINGERLVNPNTGFHDFVTDRNGLIHLPAIEDGTFLVTEIRAALGYFGLTEAVVLNINSQTRQQDYLLVIENTPASGLLIIKRDAHTGALLQGVEFEVRRANGQLVRGQMADQNQPGTPANSPNVALNGNFLTDHRGMIHLNHLTYGVYHIVETVALPGYILDSTVHIVTITPGVLSTLEVVNVQMSGLRLYKIDSVTRMGIQGVEFRIYDFITNREVAGPFITDNNGVIDFTGILPAGRYTIRETRAAQGYLIDTMPRTIEFRAGMVTEVVWENTREAGQIQITKLSSADNEVNGLPRGSRLEGAVFEVRDWRTGNIVDQFVTDSRGVGVSRPLPLGRYLIEEIVAPAFYRRSDVVLDITIEHSGQIVRYNFYNEPANIGVEVRKTGPAEVMPGQPIIWNVTTIANSSTIALSDFYFRDIFPSNAVRLERIFTGTFNQSLRYSVMFRTNLNSEWRVAYDNLSTTTNNALAMSPAALGLAHNERVTEIMFSFGTVRAGFRNVENPRIEGTVLQGLQNGYEFVNRVDVGGRTGTEWVIGNSSWVTRVFNPPPGRHPQTGR